MRSNIAFSLSALQIADLVIEAREAYHKELLAWIHEAKKGDELGEHEALLLMQLETHMTERIQGVIWEYQGSKDNDEDNAT